MICEYINASGDGVEEDYGKAFEWYTKAAGQGSSSAAERIHNMADNGLIGENEAAPWLS